MAEFVQLRKEKWAEPLNLLVQLDLLNQDEFSSVVRSVNHFEHKIQSQHRKLENILQYIQFECNLLITIQDRRKYLKQYDLSEEIDRFIYNEIRSQFGSAEINFTDNIEFWNAKLKFVAMIVPDQDKESEFTILFKNALSYCGRANLEIYKSCVDYLWSFARKPPLKAASPRKKSKRASHRRDLALLMNNIRRITTEAVRNFPENTEASIWVLTTELKYLHILREEQDFVAENPKVYIPYSIADEIEKSGKLINVVYDDLVSKNSQNPQVYIQLYDSIRMMPLPEARQLSKKTYANIVSIKNRTPEVFAWLIGRSMDDNNIDEFLERINQALSIMTAPKIKMLEICVEKMDCFLERLAQIPYTERSFRLLLQFYARLLHKDNPEWSMVSSEALHASRIQFIRKLPRLLKKLPDGDNDSPTFQSFQTDHQLDEIVHHYVMIFPSSFFLVKERILCLAYKSDKVKLKPAVILKYLREVNWKNADCLVVEKFLKFVYYAFLSSSELWKNESLEKFLKLPTISIPFINELRVLHLKKMYIEDVEHGRIFYEKFRSVTSDWRFAGEVIKTETVACRNSKRSETLTAAYEDAMRFAGTTSTEPWKMCIMSHLELKHEKEASDILQRALKIFGNRKNSHAYEDLMKFSQKLNSA